MFYTKAAVKKTSFKDLQKKVGDSKKALRDIKAQMNLMDLKIVNLISSDPGLPKGKMYATSATGGP